MTKIEIEEQIRDIKKLMEDSQEKLSELEKMLSEKSNEIPPFPTFNNESMYYYLSDCGNICVTPILTREKINDFNAFHSEDFVREYARISRRTGMLLHCKWYLCPDYIPNFSADELKWYVFYNHDSGSYMLGNTYRYEGNNVYFDTEENAQRAADWMNEYFNLI